MASIIYDNKVSVIMLKFTVALVSLGLCCAQPILNNNVASQEDVLSDVTATNLRKEDSRTKAGSALVQLVVDNGDARIRWFKQREQALHDSRNGANGHFVRGKDNDEADASAIPQKDNAPVATPEQLLALIKKKTVHTNANTENRRVIRQNSHPGIQIPYFASGYPNPATFTSPYEYQSASNTNTSPAPLPSSPAPVTTTANTEAPSVDKNIQNARDEYRKNRFAGSAYALALKLSKAGNTPLSEGGSYSGR